MNKLKINLKTCVYIIFALYMIALLKITVFRDGITFSNLFVNGKINFLPFAAYLCLLYKCKWFQFIYLLVGNIIWFLPFGAILPMIFKKADSILKIAVYALSLSLSIEIAQYIFGTGISESDDLILNALGAVIGLIIYRKITLSKQFTYMVDR